MFTREGLLALHAWTHDSLDLVIRHAATLPGEAFTRELAGFGHASLRNQLVHVLSVESAWICGLRDAPIRRLAPADYPTADSLNPARLRVMANTVRYLRQLPEECLNAELTRLPADWVGPPRSPAFILHHIATHAFHHKGQMVAMCRLLDYPAPDTDLQR